MKKLLMILYIVYFALFVVMFESCVPLSKFNEQKKKLEDFEKENNELNLTNQQLQLDNTEMSARIDVLQKELAALRADSARHAKEIAELKINSRQLENSLHDMTVAADALKRGSQREISELMSKLEASRSDLQKRENEMFKLSNQITEKQLNLLKMEQELESRNKRLVELEKIVSRQDSAVRDLRNKVSAALVGLENDGLTVSIRHGKVYVSLEEQLLFKSGSIVVDPAGVNALRRLAVILEQNPDISITIEGHTDNVPLIAGSAIPDNWDLSVRRATSIVRILLSSAKISPERLTAAGRGEFVPVDPANTPTARQKNRRTEIILMPKLDELFQMLE